MSLLSGCGVDLGYVLPAAVGQFNLLARSVPLSQAIANGNLSEEQVAKLNLIQEARAYAGDVLRLNVDENYTMFYDAGDQPVAYNVSACRKDAFVPRTWTFPLVGTVPYLGFFDQAAAQARFNQLEAEGLDVFMYEIDAYSSIGFLPNPVLSPMLTRADTDLVETVLHELLHSTVWRVDDTSFNESLATFYGRRGLVSFLADRRPERPELIQLVNGQFEDVDRYNSFAQELYAELDAFYGSDLDSAAKIAGREALYQAGRDRFLADVRPLMNDPGHYDWVARLPSNNAWMLGIRRYNLELDLFELVFAAVGEDWSGAQDVFRSAAGSADSYAFLRAWLDNPPGPGESAEQMRGVSTGFSEPSERPSVEAGQREPCPAAMYRTLLQR